MNAAAIQTVTFVTVAIAVAAVGSLATDVFLVPRRRIRERLEGRMGDPVEGGLPKGELFKDFSQLASETAERLPGLWSRFQDLLLQSDVPFTAVAFVVASATAAVLTGTGGWICGGWWLAGAGAGIGGALPLVYLRTRRRRRQRKLCRQLPEAFELMARAVRAGQTVTGAFQIVAHDLDPPISDEFAYCYEQQNLGRSPDLALRDLARHTGVMELQMFVVALLVQRRSGGNIVELLNNLSSVVRKRLRLAGKVRALTGEGRLQAIILTLLPIGAFAAIFVVNRPYVQVLLDRPQILGALGGLQLFGALWVQRIVNVDY